MKEKRNARIRLGRILANTLELPGGCLSQSILELIDGRELNLTGCRGISVYEGERIVLESDIGKLTVYGNELVLLTLSSDMVSVRGRIRSFVIGEDSNAHTD